MQRTAMQCSESTPKGAPSPTELSHPFTLRSSRSPAPRTLQALFLLGTERRRSRRRARCCCSPVERFRFMHSAAHSADAHLRLLFLCDGGGRPAATATAVAAAAAAGAPACRHWAVHPDLVPRSNRDAKRVPVAMAPASRVCVRARRRPLRRCASSSLPRALLLSSHGGRAPSHPNAAPPPSCRRGGGDWLGRGC